MSTRVWDSFTRWAEEERLRQHEDKVLLLPTLSSAPSWASLARAAFNTPIAAVSLRMFKVTGLVVAASMLLHSSTDVALAHWLRRNPPPDEANA